MFRRKPSKLLIFSRFSEFKVIQQLTRCSNTKFTNFSNRKIYRKFRRENVKRIETTLPSQRFCLQYYNKNPQLIFLLLLVARWSNSKSCLTFFYFWGLAAYKKAHIYRSDILFVKTSISIMFQTINFCQLLNHAHELTDPCFP